MTSPVIRGQNSWWHVALVPFPQQESTQFLLGNWFGRRIDMSSGEDPSYGRNGHLEAKSAEHLLLPRTRATVQGKRSSTAGVCTPSPVERNFRCFSYQLPHPDATLPKGNHTIQRTQIARTHNSRRCHYFALQ